MQSPAIRTELRTRRAALTDREIADASIEIAASLWRQPFMQRGHRLAAYFAFDGEVDCRYLIETAWARGRKVFLPVVRDRRLGFAQFCANSRVFSNRYGIPEPARPPAKECEPSSLDVVIAPLVGFDDSGNRIGMGAGFYDRSFRFLRHRASWRRPKFVGVAYEFQKTAQIKAFSWDIPLDCVVTEKAVYSFR